MARTTLLIVDDERGNHHWYEHELADICEVVATAVAPDEAAELAAVYQPTAVLVDLDLGGGYHPPADHGSERTYDPSGFDAATAITAVSPATRIIIVSRLAGWRYAALATERRYSYIYKDDYPTNVGLIDAIKMALKAEVRGANYRSRTIVEQDSDARQVGLTSAERYALNLVASGCTGGFLTQKLLDKGFIRPAGQRARDPLEGPGRRARELVMVACQKIDIFVEDNDYQDESRQAAIIRAKADGKF